MLSFDEYCDICDLIDSVQGVVISNSSEENIENSLGTNHSILRGSDLLFCAAISDYQEDEVLFETIINQSNLDTLNKLLPYFNEGTKTSNMILERIRLLEKFGSNCLEEKKNKVSDMDFFSYLCKWIDKKGFKSDSDFYNQAGISRQTFSKLRNSKGVVSREMAFHLAVALCLNYDEAVEFLNFSGYSFNPNNRREQIISYYMRNKEYSFYELEELLSVLHEKTFLEW